MSEVQTTNVPLSVGPSTTTPPVVPPSENLPLATRVVRKAPPRKAGPGQELVVSLLTGFLSAAIARAMTAPNFRITVLLQSQRSHPQVLSGQVPPYQGYADCLSRVVADQGFFSLFRGTLASTLRFIPQRAAALLLNDAINKLLPKYDPATDYWKAALTRIVGGWASGFAVAVVCLPFDMARVRLASDMTPGPPQFSGIFDLWKTVVQNNGITGLFTGIVSLGISSLVYRTTQLLFTQTIREANPYRTDRGFVGVVSSLAAITLARLITTPLTYPIASVSTDMFIEADLPPQSKQYHGTFDALSKLFQQGKLYDGVGIEFLDGFIGSLVVVGYTWFKTHYLNRK